MAEARTWYELQNVGLGDDFAMCVGDTLSRIGQMPELYAKVFQDLRAALVRRFPYAVIFRIDDDQITVVAVYHTSRDPRGWRKRA